MFPGEDLQGSGSVDHASRLANCCIKGRFCSLCGGEVLIKQDALHVELSCVSVLQTEKSAFRRLAAVGWCEAGVGCK